MNFKVGDNVLILTTYETKRTGQIGVIKECHIGKKNYYSVAFPDSSLLEYYNDDEISHAKNQIIYNIIQEL